MQPKPKPLIRIIRTSRKKTIGIGVRINEVRVLAPREVSLAKINAVLKEKQEWIAAKLKSLQSFNSRRIESKLDLKSIQIHIFNEAHTIKLIESQDLRQIEHSSLEIRVPVSPLELNAEPSLRNQAVLNRIQLWLMQLAQTHLTHQTLQIAKEMKLTPKSIWVKNYQSKWGSCSRNGRICLNAKIIQAPASIIEYLIVHELCHMTHQNHSKKFWAAVQNQLPDYKLRKIHLNTHSQEWMSFAIECN